MSRASQLVQLTQPVLDVTSTEVTAAASENPDRPLAELPVIEPGSAESGCWFLGIDLGTTGISAVLLNQLTCQLYPLYWQINSTAEFAAQKKFRLPTTVTLRTTEPSALPLPTIRLEPSASNSPQLSLSDWKPYLKVAVPHHSPQTSQWEPILQWSESQTLPLRTLQEVLQQQLASLNPNRASFMTSLACGALGLETEAFQAVMQKLSGIIVGYPSNSSDTYSFNVREAILQAGLVESPDQIVFIEEAIATLLSALPAADGRPVKLSHQLESGQGHLHNASWQGMTLILTAGASLTELVLVNLPSQLQSLNQTDFYFRSLPYAGQGIDQDIVSQLLYPAFVNAQNSPQASRETAYDLFLEPFDLDELGLTTFTPPSAAELDLTKRYQFQQRLEDSIAGQQLLATARSLKIALQQQTSFGLNWGTQPLSFERQDLTSRVLLPYIQRLNRELNTLLAQTNTTTALVHQVICTGGTASLGTIARWLRQKLPNATIIQDNYPRPASVSERSIASCSRVAYGLATLPLHAQVLDKSRHQFSDYFLLRTLLRTLPQQPLSLETIMQLLEKQGIDTEACRLRILALLEAGLPSGLVPSAPDLALLTFESAANPDYQALRLAPLFTKPANRTYEPNRYQWEYLQHYLETLLVDAEQTLREPLKVLIGLRTEKSAED